MKTKRILLTWLLVISVMLTSVVIPAFAVEFTDLPANSSAYTAVSVLNKLGVINGYEEDGGFKFKPENNVTRAEFTAMLLRTRGLGSIGSVALENPPFPDVSTPDVSWAIGNIRTAREMGIINGYDDGTFKPNNNVLYEEAVKMIVCALGYGEMSAEGAQWYSKYIMSATNLGFLDGAGGAVGTPATRATIASMLYNCLEVKLAENNAITNKTVLENDLRLTKKVGVIASSTETGLDEPQPNLRDNEIQIMAENESGVYETLTYVVENADEYKEMLGSQITFYYKVDAASGNRVVILATVKNSKKLTVDAADLDLDNCSNSAIAYFENEDEEDSTVLRIAEDSRVIYNGKLYAETGEESKYSDFYSGASSLPKTGSVTLLDQDNDKTYDVIFVEKYETYVVSSVSSSTHTITDNVLRKGLSSNKVVLESSPSDNVKYFNESGVESSFGAIKKGSVVAIKKSNASAGDVKTEVIICNKSVSGTVNGTTARKSIKINSKEYEYSKNAPWISPIAGATIELTAPQMGDTGVFYLDMDGRIISYNKNAATSNQQYGYIMKTHLVVDELNDSETLTLNMLTANGKKTKYKLHENVKLNGEPYDTMSALLDELRKSAHGVADDLYDAKYEYETDDDEITNVDAQQLIKFSTTTYKKETVIDEIITVTADTFIENGQPVEADKLTFYEKVDTTKDMTYYSSAKQLVQTGTPSINIGGAVVFSVPFNREDIDEYSKITLDDGDGYRVGLYDVSGTTAKVVVVYSGADNSEAVAPLSPVMVITEKALEINSSEDDAAMQKLTGYVNGSTTSYWMSTSCEDVVDTLQEGDVVRLGKDKDGYYTVLEKHVVFSVNDDDYPRNNVLVSDYKDGEKKVSQKGGAYIDSQDNYDYVKRATAAYPSPQYRAIWGSFLEYDDGGTEDNAGDDLVVVTSKLLTGEETDDQMADIEENHRYSINASWFNGAKILRYDTSGATLKIVEESKDYLETGLENKEIFLYSSGSSVKVFIIVE